MIGVLNVLKPSGITSSQVVNKVKKILNEKKVGHLGTLDPLASGVLPICVGKATRLFDYFLSKQKSYIAEFSFGFETTTLDLEGEVVKNSTFVPKEEDIINALPFFKGNLLQIPPQYSSKKVNGKKAYDYARSGANIELKPCSITIYDFELLSKINDNTYRFKITCSAGTYIRSLSRDLAYKLNTFGTMSNLIRTNCGNFSIENSISLDNANFDFLEKNIIPLEEVLKDYEIITINDETFKRLINGQKVSIKELKKNLTQNIFCVKLENKIVGIGSLENSNLKIKTYLI